MILPILISVSFAPVSYLPCAKLALDVATASARTIENVPHRQSKARILISLDLVECVSSLVVGSVCWRSNLVGGALSAPLCQEAFTDASTFLRSAVPRRLLTSIQHPLTEASNKKPPARAAQGAEFRLRPTEDSAASRVNDGFEFQPEL